MRRKLSKLLAVVLSLMVMMSMSTSVFAYTALDDDGVRATQVEGTLGVVSTNSGMLRNTDKGTSVEIITNDKGAFANVNITTTDTTSWGKITKAALIDATESDEAKEAAAVDIKFDDNTYSETSTSRTFHYSIPVSDIGKRIPICVYDESKKEWRTYNDQSYYTVLLTTDLYDQLVAAEAAVTDEAVKVQLQSVIDRASLEIENNVKMFVPDSAALLEKDGTDVLHFVYSNSTSYTKAYVGYASDAAKDETGAIDFIPTADGKSYVDIPIADFETPFVVAFKGSKYYNRTITVSKDAKKVTFDPTAIQFDQFDNLTTEEAIARADDFASVELVNALIEAIQVQARDANTDKYCAIARAYYDALSEKDQAKLDDPDYFGLDTGDASKDDPRNTAPDKDKELLVVSFGTSFNDNRVATIGAIEDALDKAYGDTYAVRRAFTAQIIINHIQSRDGESINNVEQAMEQSVKAGVKQLIVQPTHLMSGAEYDELKGVIDTYADRMQISYAKPLLDSDADKEAVAKAVVEAAAKDAGFASTEEAIASKDTAFVFMGHGTEHAANATYTYMQQTMDQLGYQNCFIGTVEGLPEETEVNAVLQKVQEKGFTKVILRPLMVVAGDHANNDMAGDDEDSWKSIFGAALGAENVKTQINGLGEIPSVQALYTAHTKAVLDALNTPAADPVKETTGASKKANPLKVKTKTITLKAAKVKKKAQKIKASKAFSVTKAQGKVTYKKVSGNKKITLSSAGKVTVKKGLKKGTYKVKVKVTAKGNTKYQSGSKTVTLKVKVKK